MGAHCAVVVHCSADLQSVHGFCCCDNTLPNVKCQRVLELALCLVTGYRLSTAFSVLTLLVRKNIWPVKNWVMKSWCANLSAVRCKWFAYGPADATATPSFLASLCSKRSYWTTRGLPTCGLDKSRTGHLVEWSTLGLVNSQTGQLMDATGSSSFGCKCVITLIYGDKTLHRSPHVLGAINTLG